MSSHWVNLLERENWKGINILGLLKKVFTSECAIPIALWEIFGWRVHADSPFTSSTFSGISFDLNLKELIQPEE